VRRSLGALAPDLLLRLHERHPDRYPVLLESVGGDAELGRYDVLFALPGPRLQLQADGSLEGPRPSPEVRSFLDCLDAWWSSERVTSPGSASLPFTSGWFVYLGYELAGEIEPRLRLPDSQFPRALAWRMRGAVVRDRLSGVAVACAEPQVSAVLLEEVAADVAGAVHGPRRREDPPDMASAGPLAVEIEEDEPGRFLGGVEAVLEAIARGDVYQANLSRGWRARLPDGIGAAELYRRLRSANPAPFAGSARLPGFTVLSSSPERLLRIEGRTASTRPIAGTRPRGVTRERDASLRAELELNEKERAEHVMLVDLERNDLGRICRGGTVRVDEFMTIESYATVHHIVSNVRGELRDGVTPGEAVAAVFPGGTITGCPKVRCMELLAGLEHEPRDAYTGSMGYLGRDGTLDLNILIRTLTLRDDAIGFRTGAGIVADSHPEAELAETRAKARGLLRALGSET
jgi:anthranilate synthase component 1